MKHGFYFVPHRESRDLLKSVLSLLELHTAQTSETARLHDSRLMQTKVFAEQVHRRHTAFVGFLRIQWLPQLTPAVSSKASGFS